MAFLNRKISSFITPFFLLLIVFSCKDEIEQLYTKQLQFTINNESFNHQPSLKSQVGNHLTFIDEQGDSILLYNTEEINTLPLTRGIVIDDASKMYNNFSLTATSYQNTWQETLTPQFIYNETASKTEKLQENKSIYKLQNYHTFPTTSKVRFFAFSPIKADSIILSQKTQAGSPFLSCTFSNQAEHQFDLLGASNDVTTPTNLVHLNFKHLTTAVRFKGLTEEKYKTATAISLTFTAMTKGEYHFASNSWQNLSTPQTITLRSTTSTSSNGTMQTARDQLTALDRTLFVIPQTFDNNAKITLSIDLLDPNTQATTTKTFTASLANVAWKAGKLITYTLMNNSLKVTSSKTVSESFGEDITLTVNSIDEETGSSLPWTVSYSTDDGKTYSNTPPSWLNLSQTSGNGGNETITAKLSSLFEDGQKMIEHNANNDELKKREEKGNESSPYNLSKKDGDMSEIEETANCYPIHNPGFYGFPAVYGNGIRNKQTNVAAYTSTLTAENNVVLDKFINHLGSPITSPYIIENNNCTPAKAELVWQDRKNLISNITYNPALYNNKGGITFKIDKNNITQGNAIIALKDANDNVLWSWHIWVTHLNLNQTITYEMQKPTYSYWWQSLNSDPTIQAKLPSQNYMKNILGYVSASVWDFDLSDRKVKIKFKNSKHENIINLSYSNASFKILPTGTYYQWGRKDPIKPTLSIEKITPIQYHPTDKIYYISSDPKCTLSTLEMLVLFSKAYLKTITGLETISPFIKNDRGFVMVMVTENSEPVIWDKNNVASRAHPSSALNITFNNGNDWVKNGILHPDKFLNSALKECQTKFPLNPTVATNKSKDMSFSNFWDYQIPTLYYNLWNINVKDLQDHRFNIPPIKTIYDPSPVGFVVPFQENFYHHIHTKTFYIPFIDSFTGIRQAILSGGAIYFGHNLVYNSQITNKPKFKNASKSYSRLHPSGIDMLLLCQEDAMPIIPIVDKPQQTPRP